jgi:hypothetical protein
MRLHVQIPWSSRCLVAGAAALALVLGGCGSGVAAGVADRTTSSVGSTRAAAACALRSGFELSLVSDRGGQASPVAAAAWFAKHGRVAGIPSGGWRLAAKNRDGATVASGREELHVIQGPDGTWQVDGGYRCS